MPAARYLKLDQSEVENLQKTYRQTDKADWGRRCQMILLSGQKHSAAEIAQLTYFDQATVLYWFDRYEESGLAGLNERPRSGRSPKSDPRK
jgi:transposase